MYEHLAVIGERGQITIPKDIREKEGLRPKDRVIVKIEDSKIVVEKTMSKKEKEQQLAEGYRHFAAVDRLMEEEMKHASQEANAMLDDY